MSYLSPQRKKLPLYILYIYIYIYIYIYLEKEKEKREKKDRIVVNHVETVRTMLK